jgi:hypothetical protein
MNRQRAGPKVYSCVVGYKQVNPREKYSAKFERLEAYGSRTVLFHRKVNHMLLYNFQRLASQHLS